MNDGQQFIDDLMAVVKSYDELHGRFPSRLYLDDESLIKLRDWYNLHFFTFHPDYPTFIWGIPIERTNQTVYTDFTGFKTDFLFGICKPVMNGVSSGIVHHCQYCGEKLAQAARCTNCGAPNQAYKKCVWCGQANESKAAKCTGCQAENWKEKAPPLTVTIEANASDCNRIISEAIDGLRDEIGEAFLPVFEQTMKSLEAFV